VSISSGGYSWASFFGKGSLVFYPTPFLELRLSLGYFAPVYEKKNWGNNKAGSLGWEISIAFAQFDDNILGGSVGVNYFGTTYSLEKPNIDVSTSYYGVFAKIVYTKKTPKETTVLVDKREQSDFRIGASLGYSFNGYRDETNLSVSRYLNTLIYIIDGNIEHGNSFHSFNFGFFLGEIERFPADFQKEYIFQKFHWEYALDYRLWGNQTLPGYFGGALRGTHSLEAIDYLEITDLDIAPTVFSVYNNLVSLNVHMSQKWIINTESDFIFSLGFPVFGYAIRPPYADYLWFHGERYENKIVSLHNYLAVFGDLKYNYKINTQLSLYLGFGFELSHINFPMPRKDAQSRLNIGMAFTF
jgi:hypothetical protein